MGLHRSSQGLGLWMRNHTGFELRLQFHGALDKPCTTLSLRAPIKLWNGDISVVRVNRESTVADLCQSDMLEICKVAYFIWNVLSHWGHAFLHHVSYFWAQFPKFMTKNPGFYSTWFSEIGSCYHSPFRKYWPTLSQQWSVKVSFLLFFLFVLKFIPVINYGLPSATGSL